MSPGFAVGEDGLPRTPWALGDPLLLSYYDTEWGMPVLEEHAMFERLSLEGFQAGLSWLIILRKREGFRKAFYNFDVDKCARITDKFVEKQMLNPDIIRNRAKIEATRANAKATIAMREEGGLVDFIWSFKPLKTPKPKTMADVPTISPESMALSKALKKKGFKFVGPTTMFALMEAIGMVDTHIVGSHRRGTSGVW